MLTAEEQKRVADAVDKGVRYLRKGQLASGSWRDETYSMGNAALPGLVLLECGAKPDDPVVQKAAAHVRSNAGTLKLTYELSLAILLLDRLGEKADKQLIQTFGLRLIAAQTPTGGWDYNCPLLSAMDSQELLTALDGKKGAPASLAHLSVLKNPVTVEKQDTPRTDNSNTQFAIAALWVARRHEVPIERTMDLVAQRFRGSQTNQGGWGYTYTGASTPAMTCVGLLGTAIGHGAKYESLMATKGIDKIPLTTDPAIKKGLTMLGQHIEKRPASVNLYFLWSLERVAMVFDVPTIGNKDWYGWGVEQLLPSQRGDGSWQNGGYPGSTPIIDTCFALLFLNRANLLQDLTENLRLYLPIADSDRATTAK